MKCNNPLCEKIEMELLHDYYIEIHWCPSCGRAYIFHGMWDHWHIPKVQESKGN